ncbi:hypothetical protein T439DRAFT_327091 [Meredithblackwellia eburnea MCA 4105]
MSTNYSLYAVPIAWGLCMAPHFYAAGISLSSNDPGIPKFANASPREWCARVRGLEKKSPEVKRILRAEAASQNGFETLALFSAAVVAGNAAGLSRDELNKWVLAYLASRVVYNVLYINTRNEILSLARSCSWMSGIGIICTLFYKSIAAIDAARLI